ncbi:YciI family protein [Sphingomonas pruni]|uniref:YciI family protein n=1 Tax=Sphingomonas pruni TaxID=40683 RepID=UPI00082FE67E|nr:YciI family protein [Sphingomonas pruni]
MRFMSIVTAPRSQHYGNPTPELLEAMGKLADREIKAGRMIDNGGLMPIDQAVRITIANGELSVLDGPFVEAKEVIGGYSITEMASKEEAVALAIEFMQLHKDHMPGWEGTCEVRAFAGFAGS